MSTPSPAHTPSSPVCAYNEWDPLEEVVVGRLEGAAIPPLHVAVRGGAPPATWEFLEQYGGFPYPPEECTAAQAELDQFISLLEAEGVRVRRPDAMEFARPYSTPDWQSASGFCTASPRDVLIVIGNEIIEATMTWRSRYFESFAYRSLLKEYFQSGARWAAAPKPQLLDALFESDYRVPEPGERRYVIGETEPVFDAADFMRCGRDLFVQRSNTTNHFGIEWMRRHLGASYRIHEIEVRSTQPMHIDTTFVPLAPGKLLINPEFLDQTKLPAMFKTWDVLEAPPPVVGTGVAAQMSSAWLSMNVLSLDERRVVCEASQEPLIKALRSWGFTPIPCPFSNYYGFGGAFHCATLDVRRRGELKSYF